MYLHNMFEVHTMMWMAMLKKLASWELGESGGESGATLFTIGYGKYLHFNIKLATTFFYCKAFHWNWWTHNGS